MKYKTLIKTLGAGLLAVGLCTGLSAATPGKPTEQSAPLVSGLADLKQLNRRLVAAAEKISPATVGLVSLDGRGAGSGVVVSKDGLILSAAHVVASLSGEVTVLFPDGSTAKAKPLGADFDRDAAMLQIIDPGTYPHVEIGDEDPLPINEWCVALGHPGGYDPMRPPPVRLGRVLHNRSFMITDCAVVGGDSGGPLFDTTGRVIGIHSNIGSTLSENRHVPISVFIGQWDDLLDGKRTGTRFAGKPDEKPEQKQKIDEDRPTLGLKLGEETDEGVPIAEVLDGSPAAKAGLKAGDVLGKVAGRKVTSRKRFAELLSKYEIGDRVPMMALREGEKKRFRVGLVRLGDLGRAPDDDEGIGADAEAKLDAYIDKMLKTMKDGKLEIKLTPEEIEEFGGTDHIRKRIQEKLEGAGGKADSDANEKDNSDKEVDGETNAKLDAYLDKMFKTAKDGKLELALTPEQIEEFGGMENIQKRIREHVKKQSGGSDEGADPDAGEEEKGEEDADGAERDAKLDAYLDKMFKTAKDGKLELALTPEQLEEFGGMERLQKRIQERLNKQSGKKEAAGPEEKDEKPKAKDKAETEEGDDSAQAALDAYLDKMLKNATGDDMEIELTPKQIERMGGMDKLMEALEDKGLAGEVKDGRKKGSDEFFQSSMKALEPVTNKAAGSTVRVLADGKEVAFGTIVTAQGRVITKDTETREGSISVRLGEVDHPATLIRRFPEHDLALFRIEAENLRPVNLDVSAAGPRLASLLTVTSPADKPAGIGVVSVRSRALGQVGFLGIVPGKADGGVVVETVVEDGAAAKAGVKPGDVITSIDGAVATDPIKFAQTVRGRKVGETIKLAVRRDDGALDIDVELGLRPSRGMEGRFLKMNEMSGSLSKKLDGFPQALQHDIPLTPSQCGGPLIDLAGRCIGINVSRAGRVKTFAIPSALIKTLLAEADGELTGVPEGTTPEVSSAEIDEINRTLEEIRSSQKTQEKRLESVPSR